MPRKPRELVDGAIYHVFNRGNDRWMPLLLKSEPDTFGNGTQLAIRNTGKILSPEGNEVFFAIQRLNSANAANFLSINKQLTHYIDIPVSKISGRIVDIRRVVSAPSGQVGGGIEIVTNKGTVIDISNLDLSKISGGLS